MEEKATQHMKNRKKGVRKSREERNGEKEEH